MLAYLSKRLRNEQCENRKEIVGHQECDGVEAVCREVSQEEKPQPLVRPPLEMQQPKSLIFGQPVLRKPATSESNIAISLWAVITANAGKCS